MGGLPAQTITRDQWGARPAKHAPRRVSLLDRPGVEVHHSVGLYGARTAAAFAVAVQRDHLSRANYADVFYSLGVWTDGTLLELRGAQFASGSVPHLTIVLAGNYDVSEVPQPMAATIARVRLWLADRGGGGHLTWHAARGGSSCPGRHAIAAARAGTFDWTGGAPPAPEVETMTPEQLETIVRRVVRQELDKPGAHGRTSIDTDVKAIREGVRALADAAGLPTRHPLPDGYEVQA